MKSLRTSSKVSILAQYWCSYCSLIHTRMQSGQLRI